MSEPKPTEYVWPDGSIRTQPPPSADPQNEWQGPRRVTRDARRKIARAQRDRARRGGRYR